MDPPYATKYDDDVVFRLIGHFIFWFSQAELSLRLALSEALRLPPELYEAVCSSYDFRTLCDVTLASCKFRMADDTFYEEMDDIIKRAKSINDLRVKIAHGSWMPSEYGIHAMHMSRQSLKVGYHFENVSDLEDAVERVSKLAQEIQEFPGTSLWLSWRDGVPEPRPDPNQD